MIVDQSEYSKLVMAAFEKKKAEKSLSLLLAHSTRGNIKKACMRRYQERNSERDDVLLRDFFGPATAGRQAMLLIEASDVEDFRTLNNFLKNETRSTDQMNIELLAWLIDFKHRPYSENHNLDLTDEELALLDGEGDPLTGSANKEEKSINTGPGEHTVNDEKEKAYSSALKDPPVIMEDPAEENIIADEKQEPALDHEEKKEQTTVTSTSTKRNPFQKYTKAALISLGLMVGSGTVYTVISGAGKTDCVVWSTDHFEKISCDDETAGKNAFHMKEKEWKNFRMITLPDTITEGSIGKLYYIKDGGLKFYTQSGFYPEDQNRTVKKLSRHIFDTYLGKRADSTKAVMADK
jgi:hypothetical protein